MGISCPRRLFQLLPLGISNPRVLSDMGLAIPRPTRLGDPRSNFTSLREVIEPVFYTIIIIIVIVAATPLQRFVAVIIALLYHQIILASC